MPLFVNTCIPSFMLCPPSHAAIIGLECFSEIFTMTSAVLVGAVIAWGVRITSTASTFLSCMTISVALANLSGGASPITSTGLPCDQNGGNTSFSFSMVSSESFVSFPPLEISISVAITPGPPALVTIARFEPLGMFLLDMRSVKLKMSPISYTLAIPAR